MSDQKTQQLNAPYSELLSDVKSVLGDKGGPSKICKFLVRIIPSSGQLTQVFSSGGKNGLRYDLTYLCETVEYPGRSFNNLDGVRYYGPSFKMPYQSNYEDLNMVFICRDEMYERQVFDDWMELINPSNTFDFEYKDNYTCEVQIFKMDNFHEPQYAFSLLKAHPILVNPQQVTWSDEQFLRLGITFTYHWWTRKGLDKQEGTWAGGNFANLVRAAQ